MIRSRAIPLILLLSAGCVLKGTHTETVAQNIELSSQLTALKKERDDLKSKLDELTKQTSEMEARNEELSNTNQRLVGKNSDYARKSLEDQQEVLRLKQEKGQSDEKSEFAAKGYDDLARALKDEIAEGQVRVSKQGARLSVNLSDDFLFATGSEKIQPKGQKALKKLIPALKLVKDKRIEVEGHTDNTALSASLKKTFQSHWELSACRASKVVRFLEENGVDSATLAAVGMAEHHPIASNKGPDGRKQNRRIEIVLLPIPKPPA